MSKEILINVAIGIGSTLVFSWFEIRPLGVVFILALAAWLYTMVLGPRVGIRLENIKPLQEKIKATVARFAQLRRDKPALFCLMVSVALLLLMILGHMLSGTWLVMGGLAIVGFVSSRHSIRIVRAPQQPTKEMLLKEQQSWNQLPSAPPVQVTAAATVATTTTSSSNTVPVATSEPEVATKPDPEDEFMPEVNEKELQILDLASNEAVLLSTKSNGSSQHAAEDGSDSESIPLDLLLPEGNLPDIEKDSDDSGDEFKLHSQDARMQRSLNSSSDDEELTRGLNFHEYNVVDRPDSSSSQLSSNLSSSNRNKAGYVGVAGGSVGTDVKNLTNFVSNMIPWNKMGNILATDSRQANESAAAKRSLLSSSSGGGDGIDAGESSGDESEFEILNKDELKSINT